MHIYETSKQRTCSRVQQTITELSYPGDSHIKLLWPQGDSDETAGEVSLLLLQQVFALVQSDVEHSHSLALQPGRLELERHLQLSDCVVVSEIIGDGGDRAERVSGD